MFTGNILEYNSLFNLVIYSDDNRIDFSYINNTEELSL